MRGLALAVVAMGCGRFGFAPGAGDTRASGDACSFGPFSAPTPLPGGVNSPTDDWGPILSDDQLTMYFYSQRASSPGSPDIWWSHRADTSSNFPAATEIVEVSTPGHDHFPRPTADELELFLTNDTTGPFNVYVSVRQDRASVWGAPALVPELVANTSTQGLAISRDGLRMVLESNFTSEYHLYSTSRADRGSAFAPIQWITELNSSGRDRSPWLSADELEIYFSSNRPGTLGLLDIYRASRPSIDASWSTPENVTELNSTNDDYAPALSNDGTQLYYSYNSATSGGANADVWLATRSCL